MTCSKGSLSMLEGDDKTAVGERAERSGVDEWDISPESSHKISAQLGECLCVCVCVHIPSP